jgi:hypothetical protein
MVPFPFVEWANPFNVQGRAFVATRTLKSIDHEACSVDVDAWYMRSGFRKLGIFVLSS